MMERKKFGGSSTPMIRTAVAILAVLPISSPAQQTTLLQAAQLAPGSGARGQLLFTGAIRFRNGGPACVSCHSIAGIPFPNGGTLGPDLTHAYRKLGPEGTQSAVQTLYFPVMTPIYSAHLLSSDEQADLLAFLEQADSQAAPEGNTEIMIGASLVLAGIFLGLTGLFWRDRVRSVRAALVHRATRPAAPGARP